MADVKERQGAKQLKDQMERLQRENAELRDALRATKESEKFVGIESLVASSVWLPSPESQSGRSEDRDKGILLKPFSISYIPASWMVWYIATKNIAFLMGDVRVNNESAKLYYPTFSFAEIDVPKEFSLNAYSVDDLTSIIKSGSDHLNSFVKNHKDNRMVLDKVLSALTKLIDENPDSNEFRIMHDAVGAIMNGE